MLVGRHLGSLYDEHTGRGREVLELPPTGREPASEHAGCDGFAPSTRHGRAIADCSQRAACWAAQPRVQFVADAAASAKCATIPAGVAAAGVRSSRGKRASCGAEAAHALEEPKAHRRSAVI